MRRRHLQLLAFCLLLLLLGAGVVLGRPGLDEPEEAKAALGLPWWSVDGGGGSSSSAGFELSGTIGQPDTGQQSGGDFELSGGYWSRPEPEQVQEEKVYLPLLLSQ